MRGLDSRGYGGFTGTPLVPEFSWPGTCWEAEKQGGGLRASVSPAGNRADVLRLGKSEEVWRRHVWRVEHHWAVSQCGNGDL